MKNAVKIGQRYFEIATLADAVAIWRRERDASKMATGETCRLTCNACVDRKLYRISYNGRVWDAGTGAEVAFGKRKTAAQHDAEGWKDFTSCAS